MSRFITLTEAATQFGFASATALRKSFERGLVPAKFLVRIGARVLRVDAAGVEEWMRTQVAYPGFVPQKDVAHE